MMKVTFLGTAGSAPTSRRNLPSVALEYEGSVYLFDCGEGTQRQMMTYSVNVSKVAAIFVTHVHGDHTVGIAGLVRTLAMNKREKPLAIFVPKDGKESIMKLLSFDRAMINYPIEVKEVDVGKVYGGKDFEVTAFRISHSVPTLGYVFKQADRRKFVREKCKALGVKGVMFAALEKKGWIDVKKKRVRLEDVTYLKEGRKIVYATDTRPVAGTKKAAEGADLLIHDSTYAQDLAAMAKERGHSTSVEAAKMAAGAKCKKLALFHISARYKDDKMLTEPARKVFKEAFTAKDGDVLTFE